jgi:hypothetical protein
LPQFRKIADPFSTWDVGTVVFHSCCAGYGKACLLPLTLASPHLDASLRPGVVDLRSFFPLRIVFLISSWPRKSWSTCPRRFTFVRSKKWRAWLKGTSWLRSPTMRI